MKRLIFLIYVLIGIFNLSVEIKAQPTTWQRIFGLDSNVIGTHGIQTSDGGYLILCRWDPESVYPNATRAIKLDKSGNLVWMRNYEVQTYLSVIEDGDSNFLLVGFGGGLGGAGLLKIRSHGENILYRTYGGASISEFNFIKKYYDGGYIMTGSGSNGLDIYVYIARVDQNLNVIWANTYSDINYEDILSGEFIFDPNNNIVVAVTGYNSQISDGGILKLKPDGTAYLKSFYNTAQINDGNWNIIPINGKYAISGSAFQPFNDSIISHYSLLDTNGNLILRKYYYDLPSNYNDLESSSGNTLVLGGISEKGPIDEKMGVKKIDYSGNIIWLRRIENARSRSATSTIRYTSDMGYLITGDYLDTISKKTSIYVIKCDSNVYVDPFTKITENTQIPESFVLYQNYPNPFNPDTKIKFEIKQIGRYKMEIYDVKSIRVSVVFDDIKYRSLYTMDLSAYFKNLPSSVYFITLSGNNQTLSRKIILLK